MKRSSPVDTGWAWVIMVAASIDLMLAGIMYCTGVFNVIFLDEFNKSKALTSWCGGLQASLLNLGGLLASIMADKLGTRKTIIIGGAITSFGFLSCSFATSFIHVFICYGFITGIGLGIVYTPAIVILGFYFKRYRNIAYGLVTTGIGLGTLLFAPFVDFLVNSYTWRGAMLVISAIFMNYFVVGALMRPAKPYVESEEIDQPAKPHVKCTDNDSTKYDMQKFLHDDSKLILVSKLKSSLQPRISTSLGSVHRTRDLFRSNLSLRSNLRLRSSFRDFINVPNCFESSLAISDGNKSELDAKVRSSMQSSQANAPETKEIIKCPNGFNDGAKQIDYTRKLAQLKWLHEPNYLAYLLNLLFLGIGISCVYVHFPAFAIKNGTSQNESTLLVSVMGFGSIIGRIGIGAVTNKWLDYLSASYVAACLATSVVCFFGPFLCYNFTGQLLFSFLFAVTANCFIALMAPMCIHTVGLQHLNLAYGVCIVICGIGYLIGPPMAGALFDLTLSYRYTFALAGFCYGFGGIVILFAKQCQKCTTPQQAVS